MSVRIINTFTYICFKEIKIILFGKIYSQKNPKSGFSSEAVSNKIFYSGPNNFSL